MGHARKRALEAAEAPVALARLHSFPSLRALTEADFQAISAEFGPNAATAAIRSFTSKESKSGSRFGQGATFEEVRAFAEAFTPGMQQGDFNQLSREISARFIAEERSRKLATKEAAAAAASERFATQDRRRREAGGGRAGFATSPLGLQTAANLSGRISRTG